MPFKNACNILLSRYSITFKLIIYYTLVVAIFLAVAFCILQPIWGEVWTEITNTNFFAHISDSIDKFLDGDSSYLTAIQEASQAFVNIKEILLHNNSKVIWTIVTLALLSIVAVYVINLSNLSYSDIINHFMNSNSRYGFASNFIANLKQSALYSLLYMVTKMLVNVLIMAFGAFITYQITKLTNVILALNVSLIVSLVLFTLSAFLFGGWVPAIVVDRIPVHKALAAGIHTLKKLPISCLMSFFMVHFIGFIAMAAATVFTLGFGFFIVYPAVIMLVKTTELVLYYSAKGYNYYVADGKVVDKPVANG